MKFRFRDFLSAATIASAYGISANPVAFSDSGAYSTYNTATGSGALRDDFSAAIPAIVLSVTTTNPAFKDYFKRDWIEEDGIDVYLPSIMKHKAAPVEIEMLIYTQDANALAAYNSIKTTLATWGVFEYYDDYHKALKRLVCDGYDIIMDSQRRGMRVIHFKLKCTNVLGYDILNFNPTSGGLS